MIRRIRCLIGLLLTCTVLGCASSQDQQHTGKLELTIPGTSGDKVKTTLVREMQQRRFRIANETKSVMTFEQPASSAVIQSLSDPDVGRAPIERVTYTIKPVEKDVLVSAEIAIVSKAGSSAEKKVDVSQSAEAANVQAVLDKVAGK